MITDLVDFIVYPLHGKDELSDSDSLGVTRNASVIGIPNNSSVFTKAPSKQTNNPDFNFVLP